MQSSKLLPESRFLVMREWHRGLLISPLALLDLENFVIG